jgi:hypothetical protein
VLAVVEDEPVDVAVEAELAVLLLVEGLDDTSSLPPQATASRAATMKRAAVIRRIIGASSYP